MKRILIIDDEPDVVKMLSVRLKEHQFDVYSAFDGKEGLEKVQTIRPSLIILDIMMPLMSGTEVAAELQKDPQTAVIPIIFLSALQSKNEEHAVGNVIGGQVIFAKPYEINTLVNKINEMIL